MTKLYLKNKNASLHFYTDKGEPEGYEIKLNNVSKVEFDWKSKHRGICWSGFTTCDVFECYHIFEPWYDTLDLWYDTLK